MKICIPIKVSNGLASKVNEHFGSAPFFLICNTESKEVTVVENSDSQHIHGMCHPLKILEHALIDAVVCGGMGARAVQKLNEGGIRAYRAQAGTAEEIVALFAAGNLEEITVANACVNHSCH